MNWTTWHARILTEVFKELLGVAERGSMAFTRCLPAKVTEAAARDQQFMPPGLSPWQVYRVSDFDDAAARTITADRAVEIREAKQDATLLLVDVGKAGAGMDGIYSAAREIQEQELFDTAVRLALAHVRDELSTEDRRQVEAAIRKSRARRRHSSVAPWDEFDFVVSVLSEKRFVGELLWRIGLWPVDRSFAGEFEEALRLSQNLVEVLVKQAGVFTTLDQQLATLRVQALSPAQKRDLEDILRRADNRPWLQTLGDTADKSNLWIGNIKPKPMTDEIQGIQIVSWRGRNGRLLTWSGLTENSDDPSALPVFSVPNDDDTEVRPLEIRWKTEPDNLAAEDVHYRVTVVSSLGDELASREIPHSAKKCRFSADDFGRDEDLLVTARAIVSVVGQEDIQAESEEFEIRSGEPGSVAESSAGRTVRCFSEALVELDGPDSLVSLYEEEGIRPSQKKDSVILRVPGKNSRYRVAYPALFQAIDEQWCIQDKPVGRWRIKVRADGSPASLPEYVPFKLPPSADADLALRFERVVRVSRQLAKLFKEQTSVGQVYYHKSRFFENTVKEYLLAWDSLLQHPESDEQWALVQTVEVQSLSGKAIGLIVLPGHPLRVAWHAGYDNLVFHAVFEEGLKPSQVRDELKALDGAVFPPFLPGLQQGTSFVFADTLGFHAVAMVSDCTEEPKAAVAVLSRALNGSVDTEAEVAPTVGQRSSEILAKEILKYLEVHGYLDHENEGKKTDQLEVLRLHALRAGDGMTVTRALGRVLKEWAEDRDDPLQEEREVEIPHISFVLELYPSREQWSVAGTFLTKTRERKRRGVAGLSDADRWVLDTLSLPGGITRPRLRWARKINEQPQHAAHVATAFDMFQSHVETTSPDDVDRRPITVFGLLNFFARRFSLNPFPCWRSSVPSMAGGDKHPSDRMLTDRLLALMDTVQNVVARQRAKRDAVPVLLTEVSPERAEEIRHIHKLCDWVITLDRYAGIEYFDSPRENREVYDAYVIDCVPEREDLGCLQMITSTANLAEVRRLLDQALDLMGLSNSRRNTEFLLQQLKALSGRLAIRLTGQKSPTAELVALALSYAHCRTEKNNEPCWLSLRNGFFIPVDDVRDLLPPLRDFTKEDEQAVDIESNHSDAKFSPGLRPDLIYVSLTRKGMCFSFVEVKYRRHLRDVRSRDLLEHLRQQIETLRQQWEEWYCDPDLPQTLAAVRRAKLARVLKFYADKAHRHADLNEGIGFAQEAYEEFLSEIDRMIEKGQDYRFAMGSENDRGWVFCPEFGEQQPVLVSPSDWSTRIYVFGPSALPDRAESRQLQFPVETTGSVMISAENASHISEIETKTETKESSEEARSSSGMTGDESPAPSLPVTPVSVLLGKDIRANEDVNWVVSTKDNPHLMIVGLPGMGKTNTLVNLCAKMQSQGVRPIIFSYHPDLEERLEEIVGHLQPIDFDRLGFNPLEIFDHTNPKAYLDVAGAVRDIFCAIFPEIGDLQAQHIRKAIVDSFEEQGWDWRNPQPNRAIPSFHRFVELLRRERQPNRELKNLLGRLKELEDYGFFDVGDHPLRLWECKVPIVIRLHRTQNEVLQRAFAMMIFYHLYKEMFRRGIQDSITHVLVFDEAHRAAKLTLLPTMAKECRKYGISLVVASQEARDFDLSLFSNIATYLVLRTNESDAKFLAHNVGTSDQKKRLVDQIKKLEKFMALYLAGGTARPRVVQLLKAGSV